MTLETDGFQSGSWTLGGVGNPTEGLTPQLPSEEGRTGEERPCAPAWRQLLEAGGGVGSGGECRQGDPQAGPAAGGFISQLCPLLL